MDSNANELTSRFVQVVLNLNAEQDFATFFRGRIDAFVRKQQQEQNLSMIVNVDEFQAAIATAQVDYEKVQTQPPQLADLNKDINLIPQDQQAVIQQKARILAKLLAGRLPIGATEKLKTESISCLLTDWMGYERGIIIYLQKTDVATVAFLLPYLKLDLNRGVLQVPEGFQVLIPVRTPEPLQRTTIQLAIVDSHKIGQALLTFGTFATFGLPQPWGVLVPGVLAVAQLFFGGSDNSQVFKDLMNQAIQDFEQILISLNIQDDAAKFAAATDWLQQKMQDIDALGGQENAQNTVDDIINRINDTIDSPTDSLHVALERLSNQTYLEQGFSALTVGVGVLLTLYRVRFQLQAWRSANSGGKESLRLDWFNDFASQTDQWTNKILQFVNQLTSKRLQQVGMLQQGNDHSFCFGPASVCELQQITDKYWYFTDSTTGSTKKWYDSAQQNISCGQVYYQDVSHKAEAQAARERYIQTLTKQLADTYSDAVKGVQTWQENVKVWRNKLAPLAPSSAPQIDPQKWQAALPQGTNWVKGNTVRYAVSFKNGVGQSALGPWSDYITLDEHAYPTLDVPIDKTQLAESRHIHRQFGNREPEVVGIIPDNTTMQFVDNSM